MSPIAEPALQSRAEDRLLVLGPPTRFPRIDWRELWAYRGLFVFLAWRDVKVRYAQAALGTGWAILQPLLTMVVFTFVFGRLARLPSDGVPYPLFSLAALVPWTYFAAAISGASMSLVANTNLITKVYFPRLVIPAAPVIAGLVDLLVALAMLLAGLAIYGITPRTSAVIAIPVLSIIMVLTSAGAGFWLSALNIQYRDVKHVVPFLLQVWMYASPVVYSSSLIPPKWLPWYALNPLVGVIEGYRSSLLSTRPFPLAMVATSLATSVILFTSGAIFFRKTEKVFADVA